MRHDELITRIDGMVQEFASRKLPAHPRLIAALLVADDDLDPAEAAIRVNVISGIVKERLELIHTIESATA